MAALGLATSARARCISHQRCGEGRGRLRAPGVPLQRACRARPVCSASAAASEGGELTQGQEALIRRLTLLPGGLALVSIAVRGISEPALAQANAAAVLGAAAAFLAYFVTTLRGAAAPAVAAAATALRPAQDALLAGAALAGTLQLGAAGWLMVCFPEPHAQGTLLPLYAAGYGCLWLLAGALRAPRLKGRVVFQIEEGEGERHPVMAQGSLLAARNYVWGLLGLHLGLQSASASAALCEGGAAAALTSPALAAAAGLLAAGYALAGAFKFVPGLQWRAQ
ncbi:hypothetical protein HYH03_018873 [Edaphochlamys debaryana]|uniref:Uncharacterized protein n=1 Tax=Edaphochlamys debaryana TaxID=47281 RepID=A0A836BP18_9CHLO|nr:hypothetical protein HYH03_018873 [Edaphochlamys debaryana]|eukprot:KAG2482173.1 hypothetical protein HYH03_018873 [Edaphochlamys debaryana]